MGRPKSRGVFSMFLRRKKSSPSLPSNTPDPMPIKAANTYDLKKRDKSSDPISLYDAQYSYPSPSVTSAFAFSSSSLASSTENLDRGSLRTGQRARLDDQEGFQPIETSYTREPVSNFTPNGTASPPFSPTLGSSSPLLLLPAEIRNVIYEYVIGRPCIRIHTRVVAGALTPLGAQDSDFFYRWKLEEPPRHTSTRLYHAGARLHNVTNLWHACKQIYRESYTLSLSRINFSFGNHLVAQDFLAHKNSDGTFPSSFVTSLLVLTLAQFENLPVADLKMFARLKKVAIQCPEKTHFEWALWDEMPKEKRDCEREKEKQAVRERVSDRLREVFPERGIEIQIGHPPASGPLDEEALVLYWDGGKTM